MMLSQKIFSHLRPSKRVFSGIAAESTKTDYYKNSLSPNEDSKKPTGWDDAKPFKSVPGPTPLPIIGNGFRFLPGGEFHNVPFTEVHNKLRKKFGKFVALRSMPGYASDIYICFDPDDIETMYRNEGTWPDRMTLESLPYYRTKIRNEIFQGVHGLISENGEGWSKFRSAVNPILMQPKTTTQYLSTMDTIADEFIESVKLLQEKNPEMPEDFLNLLNKWALESIAAIALDQRLGCLDPNLPKDSPQNQYINCVLEMFELMFKLDVLPSLWRYFNTRDWKRYVEILDYITFTNMKYIDEAFKRTLNNPDKNENEMSVLEKLVKKDKKIALAMVMDMLVAGVDTTSRTLGVAAYYLARNPEKQELLRKEALKLLPAKNSPITKEVLAEAAYLKAVIKETTRLAPVASVNLRRTATDTVIAGYQVPKGTMLMSSQLYVATSEDFVKKPLEFLPERWLRNCVDSELSFKNMHAFVYMPFGFGPRSCIGKRLANLELEIALLKIVRNFELSWHHGDMPFSSKLLYGIDGPLKLHLKSVEN